MNEIILILIVSITNLLCFYFGAKISQKVINNEKIEIPSPIEKIHNIEEKRESAKEQEYYQVILDNIDNYDGTGVGQKDVPKRK